ncbi:MAG: BREX-1 system adenine-specific DNA-methyltransferase PglX [Chloroflexi bacterium]|nr:MAG: BREX-1 system adenine-specific DNA-methyltransferase PglX [Chloroflexota bacterium]
MDTTKLKKFAQDARRQLLDQVGARLDQVLQSDSVEIREKEEAVNQLREQIKASSREDVIDRVAYTWFNRFCALRYMDVNHFTRLGIVSPAEGATQPEILQEAKAGVIDDSFRVDKQQIVGLLNGQLPSSNPQQEAYRLLLVAACNAYHKQMPFLFQEIDDYTELLMPDDLLSENSILQGLRETLAADACKDVEVIGWLYQSYISERKEEVFDALRKNKKIEADDIPAATQIFTPHWVVRYLVENTLGRLWMLNHPDSMLIEQMDYYIAPIKPEANFIEVATPKELKICDPACGSGHILTYAFDLLFAIYDEEGYDPIEIPSQILENNLFGIEIDERAGHLAAFAIMMKAREKDRRFLDRGNQPNILVLENIRFTVDELSAYKNAVGRDFFTDELWSLVSQFEQAKTYGSLIRPRLRAPGQVLDRLDEMGVFNNLFLLDTNRKVKQILRYAEALSQRYHIVLANPPYMGTGGMCETLKEFANDNYFDSKSDTYAMFIERNLDLVQQNGSVGMITIPNWMFLSSFKRLRNSMFQQAVISSLIHNGRGVWGSDFGSCSFVLFKMQDFEYQGVFKKLYIKQGEVNSNKELETRFYDDAQFRKYAVANSSFLKIPNMPIAYWLEATDLFEKELLGDVHISGGRTKTHNNSKFVRFFWEVAQSQNKWKLYANGGEYRRYYGNDYFVVDWSEEARSFYEAKGGLCNPKFWNKEGITWSLVTIAIPSFRVKSAPAYYSSGAPTIFNEAYQVDLYTLGFLNSKVSKYYLEALNPTVNNTVNDILSLPYQTATDTREIGENVKKLVSISTQDWDSFEVSTNFFASPLLKKRSEFKRIATIYERLRAEWTDATAEMKRLEETNNSAFIAFYDLGGEVTPEVPLNEITLNCNSNYRYGHDKGEDELDEILLSDTIKEFVSYSVGCMFGRYSLDKGGLILANSGQTLNDYMHQIPQPTFSPDGDNVIPLLEGEWFDDDIAERFKEFLKVTFGEESFEENMAFLEQAIGKDVRTYFVKDFYKEHVKMYRKRPIYWLFSSPNGTFNALIYMHRYRPDTISVILNDYLRQFREKLSAYKARQEALSISESASHGAKTKALKNVDKINKQLVELKEYEDEILYPLATQQIEIDLDDGVKVNYNKFGNALKRVPGLST